MGATEGNVGEVCEHMAGTFLAGAGNHLVGELEKKANAALPADIHVLGIVGYISGEMYAVAGLMVNTTICKVFDGNTVKLDLNAIIEVKSSWSTVRGFHGADIVAGAELDLWTPYSDIGLGGQWTVDPYGNAEVGVAVTFHF